MKSIKFIALVALMMMGGMTMKAQDYHPIVEDGKQWNVLFSYPWNPPEPPHRYTDIYKIEGDTLVDGVSYKVMYTTRNEDLTGWSVCGVIRETEDKQVLYRRDGSAYDEILYDFSMEVGDTIIMNGSGFYPDWMFVVETNEILINGEPRKQIVLEYSWGDQEVWIEGIGSLYGIIDSGSLFLTGGSTNLLCYYEDGDLIWQNTTPGYDECYIVNSGGGQQSGLVITPTVLTFDEPAEPQTFTISNQYDIDVTITNIYVQPDDSIVLVSHTDLPQTLQPNESIEVEVELNAIGNKGYNTYHIYVLTSEGTKVVVVRVNDEIWNGLVGGPEWYYEIENENGSITYQYMYQAGDTIINDEPTHILVKINTLYDKGLRDEVTHEYVYERDGKVYWWNKTLEVFTVLYDYEAEVGDIWGIKVGTETLDMHVDAVEDIEYEGKTYRVLHVSDSEGLFSGDIMCGIGHLTSFFPERLMRNTEGFRVEGLRCYWVEDELVFKLGNNECDAIYDELHGMKEDSPSTGSETLMVYPNPGKGVLNILTAIAMWQPYNAHVEIYDLNGRLMHNQEITGNVTSIYAETWPVGTYVWKVMANNMEVETGKWVKE